MSSHDCMVCGTEEPCQCPPDPLLEQVQRAWRRLNIELIELRRRDVEKDATIAQLRQALAAVETEQAAADAFREASGLLVGGDPGGVTPALLAAFIQRQERMIAAWHRAARKYRRHAKVLQRQLVDAASGALRGELPRPISGCEHIARDGTCGHPAALSPECHLGVVCPQKREEGPC